MTEPATTPATQTPQDSSQVQAPEAPKPPIPHGAGETPDWLPERLAQAGRTAVSKLLGQIGVKDDAELKTRFTKLVELEKASMSEAEKRQAEIDALKPKAEKSERLSAFATQIVGDLFNALPEAQRTAIDKVASGDAEQRWQLMQLLKDAGTASGTTPAVPVVTPASTAPAGAPPPPTTPAAPETPYQVWQRKIKEDPIGAGIFYASNALAIERSLPASTT